MKILGVIPARYASTRFPGKPLVVIEGKSMIQRVFEQALLCKELDQVIVATDNEMILKHVESFGGSAMMTSEKHRSGTERCAEVADRLINAGKPYDVVINIQGDEPYIDPSQIAQVASCFRDPGAVIATLIKKITYAAELTDPNVVKVVTDWKGKALYFSRAAIPFTRGKEAADWIGFTSYYKHLGIYGYQTKILHQLVTLPVSPLESAESLEQLRWLGNGFQIQTQITDIESFSVDVPSDLLKITNRS
ncbi:MAG: 3-deoxy-manno-octulosonate cytidylyltransferase [Bacteroidales bacterium]|nr:3-deoxy-manno-octulosonate cytidylyltransferase [Bacteroidales bacterium]